MPMTPKGTLTQKTRRQSTSESTPPTSRPMNEPPIAATELMPIANPRRSAGNASVRIAVALAISIAPPMPCRTRTMISHSAPPPPSSGSTASRIDATVNTAKPAL